MRIKLRRLVSSSQLFIASVVLAATFFNTHGLECYQCVKIDDDDVLHLPEIMGYWGHDNCSYIMKNQLVIPCVSQSNVCLKFTGKTLKGKYFEKRICGHIDEEVKIGPDECKPLMDVGLVVTQHYNNDPASQSLLAESIILCTCSTDGCNNATVGYSNFSSISTLNYPSFLLAICTCILAGLLPPFSIGRLF